MYKQLSNKAPKAFLPSKGSSTLLSLTHRHGSNNMYALPLLSTRAMLHTTGSARTPILASLSGSKRSVKSLSLVQNGLKSLSLSQARWFSKTAETHQQQGSGQQLSSTKKLVSEAILAEVPLVEVKKVLVVGSGGLTIGQAGEFDYSGTVKSILHPFSSLKARVKMIRSESHLIPRKCSSHRSLIFFPS